MLLRVLLPLACWLALVAGAARPALAQSVHDKPGISGESIRDGDILNSAGQKIGYIKPDGNFYSQFHVHMGRIDAQGVIHNHIGDNLGTVTPDGQVLDHGKHPVGSISPDGVIHDKTGKAVGTATGVPLQHAAVVFFYFED